MGKNVYTEIKCHSLLPLDDIVKMVVHRDTIPEVKDAYVNFLTHCYIDTEVEMKEIYTSNHMWDLFEKSFLLDMAVVSNATHDRLVLWIISSAADDPSVKLYNHGEGPYQGLLLVESANFTSTYHGVNAV